MGVLAGRFPGKVKEGKDERMFSGLVELFKSFVRFADNYGLEVADREIEARLEKEKKYFYF